MISPCKDRPLPHGFTLIETVVVLLIVSLLIAMAAAMTRGVMAAQQRSLTATRMAGIDAALAQFVATQKRLPCPALGTRGPGDILMGTEERSNAGVCLNNQQDGIVPFRALGLVELDALDGWGRRLTYRVDPALALDGAMDMSACDPAGAANATGAEFKCVSPCPANNIASCTPPERFLTKNGAASGKGLQVRTVAGAVVMNPNVSPHTGAAYVVISAGETGGGAYLPSGVVGESTVLDGLQEARNYATQAYTSNVLNFFIADAVNDTGGTAHFDDILSHPTVLALAMRAGLGPRPHY